MFKINKKVLLALVIILAIFVVVGANFIFTDKTQTGRPSSVSGSDNLDAKNLGTGAAGIVQPMGSIEVPQYAGRPINEVRLGAGFSAPQSAIAQKTKDLNVLKTALEKDLFNISDWIAVGIIKKFFNDFEGARDAWEYVTVLYPSDPLAFENLGNLYALYLHDNAKAEYNYKKAIENNPSEPSFYIALADFYKLFDTSKKDKVPEVIFSGLDRIKDANLYLYLATYFKGAGNKEDAIRYYKEVQKLAQDSPGIQEEISRLSQ